VSDSPDAQPTSRRGPRSAPPLTPKELEARLRVPGALSEEELLDALSALDRLYEDPGDDDPAWHDPRDDPGGDTLPGDDAQPGDGELDGSVEYYGPPGVPEILEAGFTHRYPTHGATRLRAGGPLDTMLPGPELAWHTGAARQRGLGALSDDELIGFMAAARRGESWQAALALAAVAELDARRAGRPPRVRMLARRAWKVPQSEQEEISR
jgi:hypothetical protein